MALINRDAAQKKIVELIKKLSPGEAIEVLSYKRNRRVIIIKQTDDTLCIKEQGYFEKEIIVDSNRLHSLLKGLFRVEFPRSRKLRVYRLKNNEHPERPLKKL
ncbi:MAG: hypothetical protein GXO99_07380 [Nitrospirae bacterium]|nr:hypothetical protein [Nitrospirota bacterium]